MDNQITYKRRESRGILRKEKTAARNQQSVHFPDQERHDEKVPDAGKKPKGKKRKKIEALSAEVDKLSETLKDWRKRAKALEKENYELLIDYDVLYKENTLLRDKLGDGQETYTEPYRSICNDRDMLREAETAYKKLIAQLEQENKDTMESHNLLYSENKLLRGKIKTLEDRIIDNTDKRKVKLRKHIKEGTLVTGTTPEKLTVHVYNDTTHAYNYKSVKYDEPYERVYIDRQVLREAEKGYKNQIAHLEADLVKKHDTIEKLNTVLTQLQNRPNQWAEVKILESRMYKLQWEFKDLQKENRILKGHIQGTATERPNAKTARSS